MGQFSDIHFQKALKPHWLFTQVAIVVKIVTIQQYLCILGKKPLISYVICDICAGDA
jgi:hypothetical protein